MKILHLATQDAGGGGGGFDAAYQLHRNMAAAGLESAMVVLTKRTQDAAVTELESRLSLLERLRHRALMFCSRLQRRFCTSPYFAVDRQFFSLSKLQSALPFVPDAIIVHWVSNFLTTALVGRLAEATEAPVFWYFMDMRPMTGGCHYAFDCLRYQDCCGRCPQVKCSFGEWDVSRRQMEAKRRDLSKTRVTAVVGSSWLMGQARRSALFSQAPVHRIMLGLDTDLFAPAGQAEARSRLGLPASARIVFFGAHSLSEERKGLRYFQEALRVLHEQLDNNLSLRESILIVTAGVAASGAVPQMPFAHQHLGILQSGLALASAYQGADVFVNASIEDSGPMMVNQAILCGTPVVSFDMGVAADLVHNGQTGYRARLKDARDMATGLLELLEMDGVRMLQMRDACRRLGLELCDPAVQVRSFAALCSQSGVAEKR